jgi:hypothetical protein
VLADMVFEADDPRVSAKASLKKLAATTPLASKVFAVDDLRRAIRETDLSSEGFAVPRLPALGRKQIPLWP